MNNAIKIEVRFNPGSVTPVEVVFPGCVNHYVSLENALVDIEVAVRKANEGEYPFGREKRKREAIGTRGRAWRGGSAGAGR